ncbi:DUF1254 domain-containing protein [Solirubrobacter phytolaccae]|uniref:DUF1254 domain-containing protein n=1 Tax=Solirubrobacter phytolaccae TaxID=1404360 RepID=A0A9X3SHH5_9ACTN|nr:DUF1254 domain-containing protein [Solirubrobacter phytolaccae]MDA0183197.1 DUF1254 domain-containing protein [Solirubrobacter phytolaccae]
MTARVEDPQTRLDELTALAAEAFIYGFPLVFDLQEVDRFARAGMGSLAASPLNVFSHATGLAGPKDTFVSVNNDSIYSIANVDTSGGPVRLEVPDTDGRYYVLQFVDAWTNNFAYVGRRATGTTAGVFLLVPPGWDGADPDDATVIRFPTAIASIVGRWAVDGEHDLPAVQALQRQLTLVASGAGAGLPEPTPELPEALAFFERMRLWMQAFPPAARDLDHQQRFEPLWADRSEALTTALRNGYAAGRERLEQALKSGGSPQQNGWSLTYHAFDYNLDFFEVGALDEERWKLPDDATRYLLRAMSARAGLWGNHAYEAAYAMVYDDGAGEPLDGAHRYELRFAKTPPVGAFWSVTMYDTPDFFLVDNPASRYSIGDRTPGLRYADDGSLTLVLQHDEPAEPERAANWLPTPAGPFRPILRMYEPADAVFDGTYVLPPIERQPVTQPSSATGGASAKGPANTHDPVANASVAPS